MILLRFLNFLLSPQINGESSDFTFNLFSIIVRNIFTGRLFFGDFKGAFFMNMKVLPAEHVLDILIHVLTQRIDELKDFQDVEGQKFQYGERLAYTECLECVQLWEKAKTPGLNFEVEDIYPL